MDIVQRCNDLDRLLTVELGSERVPMGMIAQLYDFTRGDGPPITLQIADALLGAKSNAHVGIMTGVYIPEFLPLGEHDGPVSAVVLGKVLTTMGMKVSILIEGPIIPVVESIINALDATGIEIVDSDDIRTDQDLDAWAERLDIGVAIEKAGINRKGVLHGREGAADPPWEIYPYADGIFERMLAMDKLTIGIGDGGNEIGFGKIFDYARKIVRWGAICKCPCQDGIITKTSCTHLFPTAISNWGIYGIIAAMALRTENLDLLHRPEDELRALDASVAAGCVDGSTGQPIPAQDSVPADASAAICLLLCTIVEQSFRNFDRGF
jgi:D-glutamate cyclase